MAEICEKQGGQEDLKLAWELYNRSLIIQSELAEKQKSIQSYTDQIIGLYHVACHPMTEPGVRQAIFRTDVLHIGNAVPADTEPEIQTVY